MQQRRMLLLGLVSVVLGAGAAVGIVEGFSLGGGHTKTVVEEAPLASHDDTSDNSDGAGLTARDIYKRDAPGVVYIKAEVVQRTQSPFDLFPQEQRGEATGSGFVIDKDGTILTNAHVINGSHKVTVQFANKQQKAAKILGKDESTDLALLKVDPAGLNLSPLQLGSSSTVQVGDPAVAIGNPFGLERTLTTGVISAVHRPIQAPNGFQIDDAIQTDAPINPGNSGGPLIDATGKVIGINSQIETGGSGSNGNIGIGFAVPIDTAKRYIPQLKKEGHIDRGYLGVGATTIDKSMDGLNLPVQHGALVESVTPGGPAERAGLRGGDISATINGEQIQLGGDIITEVDGKPIASSDDLTAAISNRKPGDKVKVTFLRAGKTKTAEVTLADRPASADATSTSTTP
jgi:S1-C subfamily serine protease